MHKKAVSTYDAAVRLLECVQQALQPGVPFEAVYDAAAGMITDTYPHLADKFGKDVGFLTGIELRDSCRGQLKPENDRTVEEGMIFQTRISLTDLVGWLGNEKKAPFCVYIIDTVVVTADGCKVLTTEPSKKRSNAVWFMDLDEKVVMAEPDERPKQRRSYATEGQVIETRLRDRSGRDEERKERQNVEARQEEFRERKIEELKQRFLAGGPRQAGGAQAKKKHAEYEAYSSVATMPEGLNAYRLAVDTKNECVLLPINGQVVPVNLAHVKTVPKPHEDGGLWVLRINFAFPGVAGGGGAELFPSLDMTTQVYVKEMNFRCRDRTQLEQVSQKIKDTQKAMAQKKVEQKQKDECKEQPALVPSKDPKKPALRDCFVRPHPLAQRGKRQQGTLTAEDNGFRFLTSAREKIDIIYDNIKMAIYKDCDNDHVVCVHLHLKSPIMIGKKQTQDVQFYYDLMGMVDDADQRGSRLDEDEIAAEEREKKRIEKMNVVYLDFCKDVERSIWAPRGVPLEFDIPHRGFMFSGVATKGNVDILPGNLCLCALNEMPFFVLTLEDVDIVVFERMGEAGKLSTFDMSFVFKDFSRMPHGITAVPTKDAESLRTYFTEIGLVVYDSTTNMTWPKLMKEINRDVKEFAENGGWESYFAGGSEEDEGSEDEGSEYSDESDDESSDEDSGSDFADSDEEESGSGEEEDEEEAGLDWDEIEEKARADDKEADRKRKEEEQSGSRAKRRRA